MKSINHISRFFTEEDESINCFNYLGYSWDFKKLKWWSRRYEYKWAINATRDFFNNNCNFLSCCDIATGSKHPGSLLMLNLNFSKIVATDLFKSSEWRFSSISNIEYRINNVTNKLKEKFDCIWCISVLEHLNPKDQQKAIINLCNSLTDKSCMLLTFDMPGFDYKTDIFLYLDILKKHGFNLDIQENKNNKILSSKNNEYASKEISDLNLNCYRLFSWRE